ncbi:MAG: hypothetical protein JNL34_07270 [Anaerolineae bacterium]|nr:hypothetical protein [Anaerolineae bacterium]
MIARLGRRFAPPLIGVALAAIAAGCQTQPDLSVFVSPPDHSLLALYRAHSSGSALSEGRAWLNAGDSARAVEVWSGISALDATETPLLSVIAVEAFNAGDYGLARAALQTIVVRDPADHAAQFSLGLLLAAAGSHGATAALQAASAQPALREQAQAMLGAPVDQAPERLGWALLAVRYWPYAEMALTRAAAAPGFSAAGMAALAVSREYQGKDGGLWMERALNAGPDDAGVHALRTVHLRLRGDYAGSLIAAQRAAALAPGSPAMLAQLGAAYERLGELDNARTWVERAQALANGDPRYEDLAAAMAQTEDAALSALLDALERGDARAP